MYLWIPILILGSIAVIFVSLEVWLHVTAVRIEARGEVLEVGAILQMVGGVDGGSSERLYCVFKREDTGERLPMMIPKNFVGQHRFKPIPEQRVDVEGNMRWALSVNRTAMKVLRDSDAVFKERHGIALSRILVPCKFTPLDKGTA